MAHSKSILAAFAVSIASITLPTDAHANNYQDLWWNPSESGWGINISQQGDVMFATWFIYGANSQPTWIFLSNAKRSGALGNTFIGEIFQAISGSPFSIVPFVPSTNENFRRVGDAKFVFSDARTGSLEYAIDGVTVLKQITRQTIGVFNLTGSYFGGLKRGGSGCVNAGLNGSVTDPAIYSVSHDIVSGALTIAEVGGKSCSFSGNTQVSGSIMEGNGRFTCFTENFVGAWTMREGRPSPNGFSALLTMRPDNDTCSLNATIGGLKP